MATKQIAWNTGSGNITLTYQGQGDSPVSVVSDANNGSARSQIITIQTTKGGLVTKNVTVSQAACPIPAGTVLNYAYTGNVQSVYLPAGKYKLQCWGAQGGSNAAASNYGITAKDGGKGGYSEGILTLTSKTTVRIYVGGAGSSSSGGFNGGGSTTGSSSYNASNEQGVSRMGGGGGATDIRLSDGALLSRMIVAGGGSGGAMSYQKITTSTPYWDSFSYSVEKSNFYLSWRPNPTILPENGWFISTPVYLNSGDKFRITATSGSGTWAMMSKCSTSSLDTATFTIIAGRTSSSATQTVTLTQSGYYCFSGYSGGLTVEKEEYSSSSETSNSSQVGFAGGGTNGGGYNSSYYGKQNGAGSGGSFGQGANQGATNYRYCSGGGGGGWYGGGGGQHSDSSMSYCKYSGGGSGFVNTAASASNRPSGYTGLQLDSGTTYAGNTSFPSTSGGTETGHSGNGYARITRLS